MSTSKPKTNKSLIRPRVSDFWMFLIGLGLITASNFSDLQQFETSTSKSINTEISEEYSKSYVIKKIAPAVDKKGRIGTPYLNSEL